MRATSEPSATTRGRVEAFQRRQFGAGALAQRRVPSAQKPSPPPNRRWLLRAPRASAQTASGAPAEQRDDAIRFAVIHHAQDDRGCDE